MTIQEKISVMQSYANGKKIQCKRSGITEDWTNCPNPQWNWFYSDYRVKPEPPQKKVVPYESAEEFLAAQKEHGPYIYNPYNQPSYELVAAITDTGIWFAHYGECMCDREYTYEELAEFCNPITWQDGSPVGKKVD